MWDNDDEENEKERIAQRKRYETIKGLKDEISY